MKIGIDTHAAEGGGSGNRTYIRGLVRALVRLPETAEYVLYALDAGHPFYGEFRELRRVAVRRLWPRHPLARIPLAMAVASCRDRLDVLHVQYVGPPWHRGALVVTIHDLAFLTFPQSFPWSQAMRLRYQVRRNALRAAAVITESEYSRQQIRQAYGIVDERVAVTSAGIDVAFGRPVDRAVIDRVTRDHGIVHRYVLCVGRLNARKNLVGLLQAFERVRPGLPEPAHLVIAGPRDHRADELDRAVAVSPCRADVLRIGQIGDDELPALFSGASVFVYPSLFEGFGLPPLEAMASGVPVVCSRVTSLPEVVGDAAVTVDPSRVDQIADAMRAVLTDPALRARLVEKGRAQAARFSWRSAAERTFEVYRAAAKRAAV